MSEKKCKHCAMAIPKEASTCPYCRKTIGTTPAARGCLTIFVVLVVLMIIGSMGGKNSSKPKDPDKFDAVVMTQVFVKRGLKSPSTAKFPSTSEFSARNIGATWNVSGYVDAQNGFGAMMRNHFDCKLEHTGGDNWRLLDIEFR